MPKTGTFSVPIDSLKPQAPTPRPSTRTSVRAKASSPAATAQRQVREGVVRRGQHPHEHLRIVDLASPSVRHLDRRTRVVHERLLACLVDLARGWRRRIQRRLQPSVIQLVRQRPGDSRLPRPHLAIVRPSPRPRAGAGSTTERSRNSSTRSRRPQAPGRLNHWLKTLRPSQLAASPPFDTMVSPRRSRGRRWPAPDSVREGRTGSGSGACRRPGRSAGAGPNGRVGIAPGPWPPGRRGAGGPPPVSAWPPAWPRRTP